MPDQAETLANFWRQESLAPIYHLHAPVEGEPPRVVVVGTCADSYPSSDPSFSKQDCENALCNWMRIPPDYVHRPEGVHFISFAAEEAGEGAGWNKPVLLREFPQARLILLLGSEAHRLILRGKNKPSMEETIRAYDEFLPFFPLPHPGAVDQDWLKNNPWFEQTILQILQRCVALALQRDTF